MGSNSSFVKVCCCLRLHAANSNKMAKKSVHLAFMCAKIRNNYQLSIVNYQLFTIFAAEIRLKIVNCKLES